MGATMLRLYQATQKVELAEEEAGVHVGVHDSAVLLIRRLPSPPQVIH